MNQSLNFCLRIFGLFFSFSLRRESPLTLSAEQKNCSKSAGHNFPILNHEGYRHLPLFFTTLSLLENERHSYYLQKNKTHLKQGTKMVGLLKFLRSCSLITLTSMTITPVISMEQGDEISSSIRPFRKSYESLNRRRCNVNTTGRSEKMRLSIIYTPGETRKPQD